MVFVFCFGHLFFGHWDLFRISNFEFRISGSAGLVGHRDRDVDHLHAQAAALRDVAGAHAAPSQQPRPQAEPLLQVEPPDVLVTALKPSDDGKAVIVAPASSIPASNATSRT